MTKKNTERQFLTQMKETLEKYKNEDIKMEAMQEAIGLLEPAYQKIVEKNAEIERLQGELDKLGGGMIIND